MDYEAKYLSEPGAVGLFTRLTRVGLLVDAFQHRCLDEFGLLFIDHSVLRVLELIGEPYQMSPSELADILLRSSGGMTQILDRLERAGLVERARDAVDRRKVNVAVTPAHYERSGPIWRPLYEDWQTLLASRFTARELEVITEFLRSTTELGRRHAGRLREGEGTA